MPVTGKPASVSLMDADFDLIGGIGVHLRPEFFELRIPMLKTPYAQRKEHCADGDNHQHDWQDVAQRAAFQHDVPRLQHPALRRDQIDGLERLWHRHGHGEQSAQHAGGRQRAAQHHAALLLVLNQRHQEDAKARCDDDHRRGHQQGQQRLTPVDVEGQRRSNHQHQRLHNAEDKHAHELAAQDRRA